MVHSLFFGISLQNPVQLNLEVAATILFFFAVYSFFGWLLENFYNLFTKRGFFKANFFLGPFKPMYGIALLLLVFVTSFELNVVETLLFCLLIPTVVEFASGLLLEKFSHRKWWDYSNHKLNLLGHICASFSICWLVLAYVCVIFVHPGIVSLYEGIDQYWAWVWPSVGLYFLAELVLAIKRHSQEELDEVKRSNII